LKDFFYIQKSKKTTKNIILLMLWLTRDAYGLLGNIDQ